MANQFENTSWVSLKVLGFLTNNLTVAEYFNRDWEKDFRREFAPGSTIDVKFPQSFLTIDGPGYAPQGINQQITTITLDQWVQIPFEWDDMEVALKLERSEEELDRMYFEPAGKQMAQEWDSRAALFATNNISTIVGQLGTDPTSLTTYDLAKSRLLQKAALGGKRSLCISSDMMNALAPVIEAFLNPGDEVSRMFKEGYIGILKNFDLFESQSLYVHTSGVWASQTGVTMVGANQTGSSISIQGSNGDTIKQGDKISIGAVHFVNPRTRRVVGGSNNLATFTVTQDYTLTGGTDVISILPPIYGPGSQYQNVDALNNNGDQLALFPGTNMVDGQSKSGTIGLGLTPSAFAMVGAKLYLPDAVEESSQKMDPDTGIAIRYVHAWDPFHSLNIHRFDSLGGFGNLYQDNGAVGVLGA
ncbi:MAG TPA: P22 phage major capsid protein family protein [Acidobacteriaceae bacterium]|jgi:hypothetical protein|nr:P22 phage major capsid protein family protein [Acidobacteriaceae bacterium]